MTSGTRAQDHTHRTRGSCAAVAGATCRLRFPRVVGEERVDGSSLVTTLHLTSVAWKNPVAGFDDA